MATIARGHKASYFMTDGSVWVDGLSGILNCSLGHNSHVVKGALAQVDLINCYDWPSAAKQDLNAALVNYNPLYTWKLLNTGSEAVERAIQMAITLRGKDACNTVAVFRNAFHGKSLALSEVRYEVPWASGLKFIFINEANDLKGLDFDAVLYEPVQGWQGRKIDGYELREQCDTAGAYLIADEMITGFLRCGERFMSGGIADFVVSGKGLAQGLPFTVLGIYYGNGFDKPLATGWTTTGGGNVLCSKVGTAVLGHLMDRERMHKMRIRHIEEELSKLPSTIGCGALSFTKHPDINYAKSFLKDRRVVASYHDDVIRLAPCFNITDEELDQITSAVKGSFV